ncbi:uncharacterized protein EV154DRAFT_470822 [Mucor mucedo]|uniref:uncharacterized protein n=1 Tax=Mucor mucedo TaxID=29922 RepID=UPI00221F4270|nr:uncharacterized protein EV154DRAFT_470822 [Mucor mucedo]KAI7884730.1 hypothetical protein EV154DRAFT_470822 [Mucor mucedo]
MKFFFCLILIAACVGTSLANTEKLILEARLDNTQGLCDGEIHRVSLTPPYTQTRQSLIPQSAMNRGSSQQFQLDDLKDGSNYEIRISYPAITPADFKLDIIKACKTKDNTLSYILDVSAVYTGVSHIKGRESSPVIYDLVLENLYAGFLFYQVYKIVIAILSVLVLGHLVIIPAVKDLITKDVHCKM